MGYAVSAAHQVHSPGPYYWQHRLAFSDYVLFLEPCGTDKRHTMNHIVVPK